MLHLRLLGPIDLRDDLDVAQRRVLSQPKRLALLTYLALIRGQSCRRDVVLALLWPELDTARARAALRQALHHLRRELGADVLRSDGEELSIEPALLQCDVVEFRACIADRNDAEALALYRGLLLEGVHVTEASVEWESWLEGEREHLREAAAGVARRSVAAATDAGDQPAAIASAERGMEIAPADDAMARILVAALAAGGDRAAALRAGDRFVKRLDREYGIEASSALTSQLAELRGGSPRAPAPARSDPAPSSITTRRRWARPALIAAAFLLLLGTAGVARWRAVGNAAPTVLAVGLIRDHTGAPELAAAIEELLATDLARAAGSRVVSTSRMFELVGRTDSALGERQRMAGAARLAGAQEFIEGALYRDSGGLRLDLERVDLTTGRAISARSLRGADPFVLAEAATATVLGPRHLERATGALRDVVAATPMALRFYQEGLRARAQKDPSSARRFFTAAVAEDSAFAMATFELAMLEPQVGPLHARALRLATRTSDRERLVIQTTIAHLLDEPSTLAYAETLAIRYPTEPEGPLLLGRALISAGRFAESVGPFRQVIAMEGSSLALDEGCRACDAYAAIVSAYIFMDSLDAAETTAREFLRAGPTRAGARYALADVLGYQEHFDSARTLIAEIEGASTLPLGAYTNRAELLIREGRLDEADAYLQRIIGAANGDDRDNARWTYVILLRTQGRYREALVIADALRARDAAPPAPPAARYWSGGLRAMILADMGRYREAIALRDSARQVPFGASASRQARSMVSEMAHMATYAAALGDTTQLQQLADEAERLGRRTGSGMHQQMSHYIRGLRLGVLGRHDEAVVELRRSIYSPVAGFVSESFALGRELIAAGRPAAAAVVLSAALRGPVGAGGLSITRPRLEVQLARARELSGDTTSAIAGYQRAVDAWSHGDPSVSAMRADAAGRIAALRRRPS